MIGLYIGRFAESGKKWFWWGYWPLLVMVGASFSYVLVTIESDIVTGMNDFDALRGIFKEIFEREPKEKG
jgi:hypothetical protein